MPYTFELKKNSLIVDFYNTTNETQGTDQWHSKTSHQCTNSTAIKPDKTDDGSLWRNRACPKPTKQTVVKMVTKMHHAIQGFLSKVTPISLLESRVAATFLLISYCTNPWFLTTGPVHPRIFQLLSVYTYPRLYCLATEVNVFQELAWVIAWSPLNS